VSRASNPQLESPLPWTHLKDLDKVLILGGADIALELAKVLARASMSVVSVGLQRGSHFDRVRFIPDGVVKQIQGSVGRFTVLIDTPDGTVEEKAGFLVAAYPAEVVPQFEAHGLQPSKRVVPLSNMLDALQTGEFVDLRRSEWLHAAFLMGLPGEADPSVFEDILRCIDMLGLREKIQTYVFTRNVKVSEEGLDARYRRARESGTLFFRFDDSGPELHVEGTDIVKIVFRDPQLLWEMELTPDVLVVDEQKRPSHALAPLFRFIPSSWGNEPYLTPDSPRYPHVKASKAGVFALGPSRGEFYPDKIQGDVEATAAAIMSLSRELREPSTAATARVNKDHCTLCLTCLRMCPHGAVDFSSYASIDGPSCVGCGICVGLCPMTAISFHEIAPERNDTGQNMSAPETEESCRTPGIVAFLCRHSAASAFEELPASLRMLVQPVVVPCAGSLTESEILTAFLGGAEAVIVSGCFRGNCRSIYGTDIGSHRVTSVQNVLRGAGINMNRLVFVQAASNAPDNIRDAVERLAGEAGAS